MLEQAVLIARDMNEPEKIVGFAERGALLYRQNGSPESAGQLLEKAAKILDATNKFPDECLDLYMKAGDTVANEDRQKEAPEYYGKAARILAKSKKYDECAKVLRQAIALQQEAGSARSCSAFASALVLVNLAREDSVAATKAFNEFQGYIEQDPRQALQQVIVVKC